MVKQLGGVSVSVRSYKATRTKRKTRGNKDRVNIYLEGKTIEAAQERAASLGLSLSGWVRLLMLHELEEPRIFAD